MDGQASLEKMVRSLSGPFEASVELLEQPGEQPSWEDSNMLTSSAKASSHSCRCELRYAAMIHVDRYPGATDGFCKA